MIPEINNKTLWTEKEGRHPDDTVMIENRFIQFSPAGGGLLQVLTEESFRKLYQPVPPTTEEIKILHPGWFSFDDAPWLFGWTRGDRWNGWSKPMLTRDVLEAFDRKLGTRTFWFLDDGRMRYTGSDEDGVEIDHDDGRTVPPRQLEWLGRTFEVYDTSDMGLAWNTYYSREFDVGALADRDDTAISNAIVPADLDRATLIAYGPQFKDARDAILA